MLDMLEEGMRVVLGYRLTRRLGRGTFGVVWAAEGDAGDRVALKFMDCATRTGRVVVNEIRLLLALRELDHPHLLKLHTVSTQTNCVVVCMELADGSLHDLSRLYREETGGPIPAIELCDFLGQAAQALDFLAEQRLPDQGFETGGLQHCDVKPRNLLLVGDTLKVADFGLCTPQVGNITRKTQIGTPGYSPPEFLAGRVTPRSDQYALAVTYVELRIGKWPYAEPAPISAIPDLNSLTDPERPIVARALDRQWLNRWPTCKAFIEALAAVHQPAPVQRRPALGGTRAR